MTIEEPHMYDADDAVARVDSYIVSVGGGGGARRRAPAGADRERRPLGGDARPLLDANGDTVPAERRAS